MLGSLLMTTQPEEARDALRQALELTPEDPETWWLSSRVESILGHDNAAVGNAKRAIEIAPDYAEGHFRLAELFSKRGVLSDALRHIELAHDLKPLSDEINELKSLILYKLHRHQDAEPILEELIAKFPKNYILLNNMGNIKRDSGLLREADQYYKEATRWAGNYAIPFSNRLTTLHYRTDCSREEIFKACTEWQTLFAPSVRPVRPRPKSMQKSRKIRVGMISDGFRSHPVGLMITSALECLNKQEIELYAYSTNNAVDHLTTRIQAVVASWSSVMHLSDTELARRIQDDGIDILIDLCGHNTGTRMPAIAMEPAPIIVKWVGGLINTTGVAAIDYLLTDRVESPEGDDDFYTESLIRLPDDYICLTPPPYLPRVGELPAIRNGHITLGCFNNPIKINEVLLKEWALLMQELPESRLFLKGHQYANSTFRRRIIGWLSEYGILEERLIIEGPSSHEDLLKAYNRVDIALDPWPYSGGLTTCEAMLMGVPVVTLPGPTFAGRHSATHLVNAGMPELVVDSWDEYRERVIGLAGDVNSLTTIRNHLRDVLLQSPVCDAPRFAKHFSTAMRAIWQRHCEGNMPAALTINQENEAWFEGESAAMEVQRPAVNVTPEDEGFSFSFKGKIVLVDNGASLVSSPAYASLHKLGTFSTVVLDPAGIVNNASYLQQYGEFHHLSQITLGDGTPTTLHHCLNAAMSGTLEPLPANQHASDVAQDIEVIAKLPVATHKLDAIEGLRDVDWLVLDNLNDSLKVIENSATTLVNTLLIQARINFIATHLQQSEFSQINNRLASYGFRFHRFHNQQHSSVFPKDSNLLKTQATQLVTADAIFVPSEVRAAALTDNQRQKLAFLMHTAYGVHDLTFALLKECRPDHAEAYLRANGYLSAKTMIKVEEAIPSIPDAPRMSKSETGLFEKYVQRCNRYFEFGSGGSTKVAARYGKTIFGVESDKEWVTHLKHEVGPLCAVEYVDIGPTKEWGYPVDSSCQSLFKNYSESILKHSEYFDFILVDGRFRVACAANAVLHTLQNSIDPGKTHIFIHDFWDRPHYHGVLDILEEVERAETAGVFRIRKNTSQTALRRLLEKHINDPN